MPDAPPPIYDRLGRPLSDRRIVVHLFEDLGRAVVTVTDRSWRGEERITGHVAPLSDLEGVLDRVRDAMLHQAQRRLDLD